MHGHRPSDTIEDGFAPRSVTCGHGAVHVFRPLSQLHLSRAPYLPEPPPTLVRRFRFKAQFCDVAFLRSCCRAGQWHCADLAWLAFACPAGVLFRPKMGDGRWHFSLATSVSTAVLAWQAVEVPCGERLYFVDFTVPMAGLQWFVITDLDDFEGLEYEFVGTARRRAMGWWQRERSRARVWAVDA
jgi:hypothetical protein